MMKDNNDQQYALVEISLPMEIRVGDIDTDVTDSTTVQTTVSTNQGLCGVCLRFSFMIDEDNACAKLDKSTNKLRLTIPLLCRV